MATATRFDRINAIESMPDGGKLSISTALGDDGIEVRIADTGGGIDEEHRDQIFDPGFTTKGVGVGTGLGLAIGYQVLAKHDGTLELAQTSSQGSTFVMRMPVRDS